jgi:hypothetical protein
VGKGLRDINLDLGFRLVKSHRYLDSQTVRVVQHGSIDVQLVRNVELKKRVQLALRDKVGNFSSMSREKQRDMWEMGFSLLSDEKDQL